MDFTKAHTGFYFLILSSTLVPLTADAQKHAAPAHPKGFVRNVGQVVNQNHAANADVRYLWAGGAGMNVQVRNEGLSYDTYTAETVDGSARFHRLDMRILGRNANAVFVGEEPLASRINFHGYHAVPHFNRLRYNSIYPGIDMALSQCGDGAAFKYDLVLHPGADISKVQLRFEGFDAVTVNDKSLDFIISDRHLTESIPHSWTLPGGAPADVRYRVVEQKEKHVVVGLEWADAAQHGTGKTLVVDPDPLLEWATYYGDTAYDSGRAIAVDRMGRVYAAGATRSMDNIATDGGFETSFLGDMDAFVMCFLPHGSLLWVTYYGGEAQDVPTGIAVDTLFNTYLVGNTTSVLAIATNASQQEELAGGTDAFVAKFGPDGDRLWGTYFGGTLNDSAAACVLDGRGGLFLAGTSESSGIAGDSIQPLHWPSGGKDAFLVHIDSTGHRIWTTFFGGEADDIGNGIAMDSTGIWLAGTTGSTSGIATDSVHQDSLAGMEDAFLARLDSAGNLQWATYFGGAESDCAIGVAAVGKSAFISGETFSDSLVTDTTAHQMNYGGGGDVFIARIDSGGALAWSTYIGDSLEDRPARIIRDPGGQVRVIGTTASTSAIATEDVEQEFLSGPTDAFITKFDTTGQRLWGGYFGGNVAEEGADIAVFDVNIMFFTGTTTSHSGVYNLGVRDSLGGGSDAFVARLVQHVWDHGDSTCTGGSGGGGGGGGGSSTIDSIQAIYPDTVYICAGDTLRATFGPSPFGGTMTPVWYENACGDPRYFLGLGDTLVLVPTDTMSLFFRGENVYAATSCAHLIVVVDPYPIPIIETSQGACLGDTLQLHASGGNHYAWTGPNGFASEEEDAWDIPQVAGDILVYQLTAFSQHGCSVADSVTVQILPAPNLGITITDASCFGASDGSIELAALDTVPLNFLWPTAGSSAALLSNLAAGQYVAVTSNAQCSRTDSITVGQPVYPIDSIALQHSTCAAANGWAALLVNNASAPYQYNWSNGDTLALADALVAGSYQVTLTDALGCTYAEQGEVQDRGSLALELFPDTALVNIVDSIQLQATLVPLDSTTQFHWSPPDALSCTDCLMPFASPQSDTWFVFTATSAYGCTVSDSVLVNTWYTCAETFVPNIFSPNNDGLNDALCVMGGCISEFHFSVTDRWGETVFQTVDLAQCWDGNLRGSPLSGGPFRYTLHVLKDDGTALDKAGELRIQR